MNDDLVAAIQRATVLALMLAAALAEAAVWAQLLAEDLGA